MVNLILITWFFLFGSVISYDKYFDYDIVSSIKS